MEETPRPVTEQTVLQIVNESIVIIGFTEEDVKVTLRPGFDVDKTSLIQGIRKLADSMEASL